jgi:hypothetical protein
MQHRSTRCCLAGPLESQLARAQQRFPGMASTGERNGAERQERGNRYNAFDPGNAIQRRS